MGHGRAMTSAASLRVLAKPMRSKANPYIGLLYSHLEALGVEVAPFSALRLLGGGYHILHVHWPENFLGSSERSLWLAVLKGHYRLALLALARRRGTRLVWTVHNLRSHAQRHPRLERYFAGRFAALVDGIISLSEAGVALTRASYPVLRERPAVVVPHGHYRGAYPDTCSREQARAALGIPDAARVFGFIGAVKPYKRVDALIAAFRALDPPDGFLCVAGGCPDPVLAGRLRELAAGDPRIRLDLGFVAGEAMQLYLKAADLVVLPYREILNSGSALLALSFERPVLVPSQGALEELRDSVGDGWVRTFSGDLGPGLLAEAMAWAVAEDRGEIDLSALDWTLLAEKTLRMYRGVAVGTRS